MRTGRYWAGWLLMGWAALAQGPVNPNELSTFSVYYENDQFGHEDRYYTNGVRLAWLSPDLKTLDLPGWAREVMEELPHFNEPGHVSNIGLAIGQSIYTPREIGIAAPQPEDRPWAGWLYLAVSLQHKNRESLHVAELTLGVVGPESLAEQAQRTVHRARGLEMPEGWDNQLHTEPGAILTYRYRHRFDRPLNGGPWGADFIPGMGVSVGNVLTEASVSGVVRVGYHLPQDFHANRIQVSGYAMPDEESGRQAGRFSVYVFGGVTGRGIARDIFLDGNTFRDSPGVDRIPWVAEGELGIGIGYRRWQLMYAHVFTSEQFREQDSGHQYGSLSVAWSF